ncbi:protein kinase domain-containing protein [Streptomyces sp. NPDC002577]
MSSANRDGQDDRGGHIDDGVKPLTAFDPDRIGPYRLLGRLGAGGMGRVFLARSESGRTVAVKVVHEEHVADQQFRARFRREIDAARRVGERYTAPVLDADPDAELPWVATGYVPGLSLEQVVRQHGPLGVEAVHALADGLLRALKDIHDAGIVHRDLKPSNVMLTVDGTRIIDFGIARALETSVESLLTSTGMVIGSPGFMSPEQIRGEKAGARSDVFTVGCVLTYAATGRLPFGQGASNQHAVMFQIAHDEPDLAGVEHPALRAFIERCLNKNPDQRPDVDALLADPERVRPAVTKGSWLPAEVVAHIAQRSARLLDADAVPLREGPTDRATVGLRPQPGSPEAVPDGAAPGTDGVTRREPEPKPRRRRTIIALPIVLVLTVGGGTFALLQPWVKDDGGAGANALPPGSSASGTPAGSSSPSTAGTASSSPSGGGKKGGEQSAQAAGDGSSGTSDGDSSSSDGSGTRNGSSNTGSSRSSGSSGSDGADSSSSGGSSTGSPPPAMTSYKVVYNNSCFGACSMPLTVSWSSISRATRYDIHYTNEGSQYTKKNVDTIYSTGNTSYTITGPYSGDKICVTVRAANKYGASAWAQTWCDTVPY